MTNTTFTTEPSAEAERLGHIEERCIASLCEAGFEGIGLSHVISEAPVSGISYPLMHRAKNLSVCRQAINSLFVRYSGTVPSRFGNRVLWFNTLLKCVEL